jgi:hypothetical protein
LGFPNNVKSALRQAPSVGGGGERLGAWMVGGVFIFLLHVFVSWEVGRTFMWKDMYNLGFFAKLNKVSGFHFPGTMDPGWRSWARGGAISNWRWVAGAGAGVRALRPCGQ